MNEKILIIAKVQNKLSKNKKLLKTIHSAEAGAPNFPTQGTWLYCTPAVQAPWALRNGRDIMKAWASSDSPMTL